MPAVGTAHGPAALARRPRARIARRLGAGVVDGALAVAFAVAMVVERVSAAATIGAQMPLAIGCSLIAAAALVPRRRWPLAAYLVGSAALVVESLVVLPSRVTPFVNLIGVYSLGLYATRARARLGLVVVPFGCAAYFVDQSLNSTAEPVGVIFAWVLVWAQGYSAARRQEERDAAGRLVRQRMVAEERSRIARELHDVVGHTLTVMLVQAGAARRILDRDPAKTRDLLAGVEHTGREALDELDRVLGLLRQDGPAREPGAQPGLADVPRLASRIGEAGLAVTVHIESDAREVPRSIDVSAYRIVQEALTNAVKHGRASTAEVSVRRDATVLDIEVRDDGRGPADGYLPGRGLLGIAERAGMFGGSVEHGGGEGGGFRLHAVLPIP